MSFREHTLDELLVQLSAPAPSPCGAATAAITAAMACSLVAMVADGTPAWPEGTNVSMRATDLRDRLLELAVRDTEAVAALVKLGRLAADEREAAIESAIRVPLAIGEASRETAMLAGLAETHGKAVMRADATAARLLAAAAAEVAEKTGEANRPR